MTFGEGSKYHKQVWNIIIMLWEGVISAQKRLSAIKGCVVDTMNTQIFRESVAGGELQ